ncbi:MAG TPA: IPT/TIG domain-containing protein [Candidatus Bathyarchaeia archaeon]|nr:IPT/TIG domain-containing protein [Candidatus Bathyarchaeia archaeon]
MSFLRTLERTSFKKIIAITFLVGVGLAMPVTVWVSQQQTKLASKAMFEKPEIIKPIKKYGSPSQNEPRIDLVWPFLGKEGDAVLIEGENFGDNPQDRQLKLANKVISEENINQWTPQLIEFILPPGATSGTVSFKVAGKDASWPYWFTVYNLQTKTQVTENNDVVRVLNAPPNTKIEIIFSTKERLETTEVASFNVPSDRTIMSVEVKDKQGNHLPFFVEPEEFNF